MLCIVSYLFNFLLFCWSAAASQSVDFLCYDPKCSVPFSNGFLIANLQSPDGTLDKNTRVAISGKSVTSGTSLLRVFSNGMYYFVDSGFVNDSENPDLRRLSRVSIDLGNIKPHLLFAGASLRSADESRTTNVGGSTPTADSTMITESVESGLPETPHILNPPDVNASSANNLSLPTNSVSPNSESTLLGPSVPQIVTGDVTGNNPNVSESIGAELLSSTENLSKDGERKYTLALPADENLPSAESAVDFDRTSLADRAEIAPSMPLLVTKTSDTSATPIDSLRDAALNQSHGPKKVTPDIPLSESDDSIAVDAHNGHSLLMNNSGFHAQFSDHEAYPNVDDVDFLVTSDSIAQNISELTSDLSDPNIHPINSGSSESNSAQPLQDFVIDAIGDNGTDEDGNLISEDDNASLNPTELSPSSISIDTPNITPDPVSFDSVSEPLANDTFAPVELANPTYLSDPFTSNRVNSNTVKLPSFDSLKTNTEQASNAQPETTQPLNSADSTNYQNEANLKPTNSDTLVDDLVKFDTVTSDVSDPVVPMIQQLVSPDVADETAVDSPVTDGIVTQPTEPSVSVLADQPIILTSNPPFNIASSTSTQDEPASNHDHLGTVGVPQSSGHAMNNAGYSDAASSTEHNAGFKHREDLPSHPQHTGSARDSLPSTETTTSCPHALYDLVDCVLLSTNITLPDYRLPRSSRLLLSRIIAGLIHYFVFTSEKIEELIPAHLRSSIDIFLSVHLSSSLFSLICWSLFVLHVFFAWFLCRTVFSLWFFSNSPKHLVIEENVLQLRSSLADQEEANSQLLCRTAQLTLKLRQIELDTAERVASCGEELEHSKRDVQNLRAKLAESQLSYKDLEEKHRLMTCDHTEKLTELECKLKKSEREKADLETSWELKLKDLTDNHQKALDDSKADRDELYNQAVNYYDRMKSLQTEIDKLHDVCQQAEQKLASTEAELTSLQALFTTLKSFDEAVEQLHIRNTKLSDTSADSSSFTLIQQGNPGESETVNVDANEEQEDNGLVSSLLDEPEVDTSMAKLRTYLAQFLDVGRLQAALDMAKSQIRTEETKVSCERELREQLEAKVENLERETADIKNGYQLLEEEKSALQVKLDVLSNYFKERELELQRDLGKHLVVGSESSEALCAARKRNRELEAELKSVRDQLVTAHKDIAEKERIGRRQIAELDKRSHENWLAARAADHQLRELRNENASLRQSLMGNPKPLPGMPSPPLVPIGPSRVIPRPNLFPNMTSNSIGTDRRSLSGQSLTSTSSNPSRPDRSASSFPHLPPPNVFSLPRVPPLTGSLLPPPPFLPDFIPPHLRFPPGFRAPPPLGPQLHPNSMSTNQSSPSSAGGDV